MMHPIENIMKSAMEEIKEMVDVNTIIGDPILTGNDTEWETNPCANRERRLMEKQAEKRMGKGIRLRVQRLQA